MANNSRDKNGRFACSEELSPIQLELIAKLIENGGNKSQACKDLGVPRSTLYKWLEEDKFVEAYNKTVKHMFKEHLAEAMSNLVSLMRCEDSRTSLKATEDILKLNGLLDTKLDINQKTSNEIVISLLEDVEEE